MTAIGAFLTGLRRALTHWRVALPLYAANLAVASLSALALYGTLTSAFGPSEAPLAWLEGFDLTTAADMLREHGAGIGALLRQLPWLALLYILISTFFAGGVLTTLFSSQERFSVGGFLHGCAEHAGRFYRLLAVMAIVGTVAALGAAAVCVLLYEGVAGDASSEWTVLWALGLCAGVCGVVMATLVSVSDYARILIVTRRALGVRESLRGSVRFITGHALPVAALILFNALVIVALSALYLALEEAIPGGAVVLWVGAQQAFIGSRIWVRIAGCASQLVLLGARYEETSRGGTTDGLMEAYRARV